MYCIKCKNEIEDNDLFCRFCGERQILKAENKWKRSNFEILDLKNYAEIPQIIKQEYLRIFSLLDDGQSYGAVLQLRDVYEICLKIPAIIALAYICEKQVLNDEDYLILNIIIEKELSSGMWHELVSHMIKVVDEEIIIQVLQEADELWCWDGSRGVRGKRKNINSFTGFSHWRNVTIGHGALAFDSQKEYYLQFQLMINKLNVYIKMTNEIYSKVCFSTKVEAVNVNGKNIELKPFVIYKDNGMFLFDAYLYGKKKYDVLNYQNAIKISYKQKTEEEQQLEKIYLNTKGYLAKLIAEKQMENTANSIYHDWHLITEELILDDANTRKTYKKVDYLTFWLKNAITDNYVSLLAMESGLGKSSWCRTFDKKYCEKVQMIDGYDVKVVYINRFYNKSVDSILTSIQEVLSLSSSSERVVKFDNPRYIKRDVADKKKEFAEVINFYFEKMHEVRAWSEEGLLLIIDGLDELLDGNLFEWIPENGMLNEKIKILFTIRNDNNLQSVKNELQNNLKIQFKNKNDLVVMNESEENKSLLLEYIKVFCTEENILISENDINTLLIKSKNNFLYLDGLLQVIKNEKSCIPENDNYYTILLNQISNLYSKKFFGEVENILGILVIMNIPISIREMAQLLGYEQPTYLLASYFKDLQTFLTVEYRSGEAFYSLAHEEVFSAIKESSWYEQKKYLTLIKNCIIDSAEQLIVTEDKDILGLTEESFKGAIYVLVNMSLLPSDFGNMFNDMDLIKLLNGWTDICNWISDINVYSKINIYEKYKMLVNIYSLCKEMFKDKKYIMFESYLRMSFIAPEFIGFHKYTDEDQKYDDQNIEVLRSFLWLYEEKNMSDDECNIYERELLIYPIYAGRVALKGLLNSKGELNKKYKEKMADSLKLALEICEMISDNPRFSGYDCDLMDSNIRELSSVVQSLVDNKVISKYKLSDLSKRMIDIPVDKYAYSDLYKQNVVLNIKAGKYFHSSAKIPHSLMKDADGLYDAILFYLDNALEKKEQYCLVSYFPPVVVIYMLFVCSTANVCSGYLSKDKRKIVEKIINIYNLYDKYGFVSHEIRFYINALVTYGISQFNMGDKEIAVVYLKKTIIKYEYYKKQPYYREVPEILGDVCNANYTLAMYYAENNKRDIALKFLRTAQNIYQTNTSVKKMFSSIPIMRFHLEGKSAETIQISNVKIGRNDLCPCGSGKKYKKCCGRNL